MTNLSWLTTEFATIKLHASENPVKNIFLGKRFAILLIYSLVYLSKDLIGRCENSTAK
jgi:hypothetical protein